MIFPSMAPCLDLRFHICKPGPIAQQVVASFTIQKIYATDGGDLTDEMICPWRNPYHPVNLTEPDTFACDAVAVFFHPIQILVDRIPLFNCFFNHMLVLDVLNLCFSQARGSLWWTQTKIICRLYTSIFPRYYHSEWIPFLENNAMILRWHNDRWLMSYHHDRWGWLPMFKSVRFPFNLSGLVTGDNAWWQNIFYFLIVHCVGFLTPKKTWKSHRKLLGVVTNGILLW